MTDAKPTEIRPAYTAAERAQWMREELGPYNERNNTMKQRDNTSVSGPAPKGAKPAAVSPKAGVKPMKPAPNMDGDGFKRGGRVGKRK